MKVSSLTDVTKTNPSYSYDLPSDGRWRRAEHSAVHDDVITKYYIILLVVPRQYQRSHI